LRARVGSAGLARRVVHARAHVLRRCRDHLGVDLRLRLGPCERDAAIHRPGCLRAILARASLHRAVVGPRRARVEVARLQHDCLPGRAACLGRGGARRGGARQLRLVRQARLHHRPDAAPDDRQPDGALVHWKDDGLRPDLGNDRGRPAMVDRDRVDLRLQAGLRVEHVRSGLPLGHRRAVVPYHSCVRRAHHAPRASARPDRVLAVRAGLAQARRLPLAVFVVVYTLVTGGPLLWVASMSLRTTAEIFKNPYGLPSPPHWDKFADAWTKSNYGTYFWNSTIVVVVA